MPTADPSINDSYFPEIAVAALDILGLQEFVAKNDNSLSAMNVLSRFVRNASSGRIYNAALSGVHDLMFTADVYFGDSIYLFADPSRDLQTQIQLLSYRTATLIALGVCFSPRFLVRAGIAVGDLRKRVAQGDGAPHEIRIGTSMTRAHQLQEGQDWIGGAIAAEAGLHGEMCAIEYPVPLKPKAKSLRTRLALNWLWRNGTPAEVECEVRAAFNETGGNETARQKLTNTLTFIDEIHRSGTLAPFDRPPIPSRVR
jgi:hypothetical protein